MSPATRFRLGTLFFLLLSLIFGCAGVQELQDSYRTVTVFPTTEATVTDVWWEEVGGQKNKRQVCTAAYRYRVNNITYHGSCDNFTEFDEPEVGATLKLHYNPRDPQDARLANFMELWFFPVVIVLFGGLGSLLVCGYCLKRLKDAK